MFNVLKQKVEKGGYANFFVIMNLVEGFCFTILTRY